MPIRDKAAHTAYMREYRRRRREFGIHARPSDPRVTWLDRHAWLPYAMAVPFAVAWFIVILRTRTSNAAQSRARRAPPASAHDTSTQKPD